MANICGKAQGEIFFVAGLYKIYLHSCSKVTKLSGNTGVKVYIDGTFVYIGNYVIYFGRYMLGINQIFKIEYLSS